MQVRIVGIVNITADSFSDGGRYLDPLRAVEHARRLRTAGADIIELGAASSHPDSRPVSAEVEIERLTPVFDALHGDGMSISIDSFQPAVQMHFGRAGAAWLNDTRGFPDPAVHASLAGMDVGLVVMHSLSASGLGTRSTSPPDIMGHLTRFFDQRLSQLHAAGIARDRLMLDPGLGFFLGDAAHASLEVLRRFQELRQRFGLPIMLSATRKSFLGAVTGRSVGERGAATLAAELACVLRGADCIRTHDVAALVDGIEVFKALGLQPASYGEHDNVGTAHATW